MKHIPQILLAIPLVKYNKILRVLINNFFANFPELYWFLFYDFVASNRDHNWVVWPPPSLAFANKFSPLATLRKIPKSEQLI